MKVWLPEYMVVEGRNVFNDLVTIIYYALDKPEASFEEYQNDLRLYYDKTW